MMSDDAGTWVIDAGRDRVGLVIATADGRVRLRGWVDGSEWDALPGNVRPVATGGRQELRAKVAKANHHSERRWGR
ncbi:hypothetical protein [Streptomyces sp. NPDC053048]|uniref:hypothetical protein n=1 Tax=Streptomyces sp. NPDC053048 TaxID=3365694 RepID=UPI0037D87685